MGGRRNRREDEARDRSDQLANLNGERRRACMRMRCRTPRKTASDESDEEVEAGYYEPLISKRTLLHVRMYGNLK